MENDTVNERIYLFSSSLYNSIQYCWKATVGMLKACLSAMFIFTNFLTSILYAPAIRVVSKQDLEDWIRRLKTAILAGIAYNLWPFKSTMLSELIKR